MSTSKKLLESVLSRLPDHLDTSKVTELPQGVRTVLTLRCRTHDVTFSKTAKLAMVKPYCPECSKERRRNGKLKGSKFWLQRFRKAHGDKYQYPDLQGVSCKALVDIVCKDHGTFSQTAKSHAEGHGCPKCAAPRRHSAKKFEEKAAAVHNGKYRYTGDYRTGRHKVTVICPDHGEFRTNASGHLNGVGCKNCYRESASSSRRLSQKVFLSRVKHIFGNKYDFSKATYTTEKGKVTVICPEHGEFNLAAESLLKGHGCYRCGRLQTRVSRAEFLRRWEVVKETTGSDLEVVPSSYTKLSSKVEVVCPKHGKMKVTGQTLLANGHCPSCKTTSGHRRVAKLLTDLGVRYLVNDRTVLGGKELDLYLPDHNLAIEFNGLYWHWHDRPKRPDPGNRRLHLDKTLGCQAKGIQLIHVFEDQWADQDTFRKVCSLIRRKVAGASVTIGARQTTAKDITSEAYRTLCDDHHLLGYSGASVMRGLYHEDLLVAAIGIRQSAEEDLLVRYVVRDGYSIAGGLSKLLKGYYRVLTTYCELAHFSGEVYEKAGFTKVPKPLVPDLWYANTDSLQRLHRRKFQKHLLPKLFPSGPVDMRKTEWEICLENGWKRIFSCGHTKYIRQ